MAQKYLTDSNEAQEFFVLNQDTGQYQKYVYIPPSGLENSNQCHELEATVDVEELEIKDRLENIGEITTSGWRIPSTLAAEVAKRCKTLESKESVHHLMVL